LVPAPATRATSDRANALGVVFAATGAASYGATIAFGRSLAKARLGAPTVLSFRFGVAALLLFVVGWAARRPGPAPSERFLLFGLGLVYTIESTLFFMALERGTAAAVALLFYSYPVVVTVLDFFTGAARPSRRMLLALCASIGGSAVVAVAGADVSITAAGIAFALSSATLFAFYLFAGDRAVVHSDAVAKATWTALGCGVGHLVRGVATSSMHSPSGHLPALIANGVVTASAFFCMFAGLRLLGPSRTSVVMTLEAFFGIVFAAVFLDESLGGLQIAGGVAILFGAALVASSPRTPGRGGGELADAASEAP
jgi:drug/metabolite transporter (DMT)-like permease